MQSSQRQSKEGSSCEAPTRGERERERERETTVLSEAAPHSVRRPSSGGKALKGAAFFSLCFRLLFTSLPFPFLLPPIHGPRGGGPRRHHARGSPARRVGVGGRHLRPQGRGGERPAPDPALRLHPLPQERPRGAPHSLAFPLPRPIRHSGACRSFPAGNAGSLGSAAAVRGACLTPLACVLASSGVQMWPDLIQKAKDGGLDVVQTYVFWNGHEPSPGQVGSYHCRNTNC
jgi:hypothetical protein